MSTNRQSGELRQENLHRVIADRLLTQMHDVTDRFLFLCITQLCLENNNQGVTYHAIFNKANIGSSGGDIWVKDSLDRLMEKTAFVVGTDGGHFRLSQLAIDVGVLEWVVMEGNWQRDCMLAIGAWAEKDVRILAP